MKKVTSVMFWYVTPFPRVFVDSFDSLREAAMSIIMTAKYKNVKSLVSRFNYRKTGNSISFAPLWWMFIAEFHASPLLKEQNRFCTVGHLLLLFSQFLPGHQRLSNRVRKRLYYGLDQDVSLDALSCPVTGEHCPPGCTLTSSCDNVVHWWSLFSLCRHCSRILPKVCAKPHP